MVALSLLAVSLLALNPVSALWPEPANVTTGTQTLFINEDIEVTYNGHPIVYTAGYEPVTLVSQEIVHGSVSRTLDNIFQKGLYPWMFHARNETNWEPSLSGLHYVTSLNITQTAADNSSTFKPLPGQVDESYELTIDSSGEAEITAASSIGIVRALETFSQLFYTHSSNNFYYTPFVPVSIQDEPKKSHRGLMLDTSRNYYSVEALLRTIDGCVASKLNVLHLHITDAQSWPLVIEALPELSAKGAYRPDYVYTPANVVQIQLYGAVRGVQVIIEIDQPEHTAAIGWAYPELLTAYNYEPYTWYCAEPPCGSLRLNDSAVDTFMDTVMGEITKRVYPFTAYFHVGGDEVTANDTLVDPSVGTNATDVIEELLQTYTDKSFARVRGAGLTPIVWEEIPLDWNVTLGSDVAVQAWLGSSSVQRLTDRGYPVIDSNSDFLYLDCGRGEWVTFQPGESYTSIAPYNDWCSPTKNWELIYSYRPSANLTAEQANLVIGAEVAIWSETIDEVTLDYLAWPRASVLSEVLWTGELSPEGSSGSRDQTTAVPRLNDLRERLLARGIKAASVQMPFCTEGGDCVQPV